MYSNESGQSVALVPNKACDKAEPFGFHSIPALATPFSANHVVSREHDPLSEQVSFHVQNGAANSIEAGCGLVCKVCIIQEFATVCVVGYKRITVASPYS